MPVAPGPLVRPFQRTGAQGRLAPGVFREAHFLEVRGQATSERPGFTLIETMVVLAILAILLGVGVPSYLNHNSNQRLRMTVRTLVSDLHVARQEAVTRRSAITVTFSPADKSCPPSPAAASYTLLQGATPVKHVCFPADIRWLSLPPAGLAFGSTGGSPTGARLQVRSARTGTAYTVSVSAETGVITSDVR